jgi:hypothetical protein
MAPIATPEPRAPSGSIRGARLARVRMIRRRVVGGAVALFVAVWILLAVTLISGHDPALGKGNTSGSSSGSGTTATLTTSGDGSSSSAGLSAVTTSQS